MGSARQQDWLLTLTAGLLEAAIMAMHCTATDQSEAEFKPRQRLNYYQREGLNEAVKALNWPDDKKTDLRNRLCAIAALDTRRNALIHLAAGFVSNNSIHGIPAGSVIDLRTYGFGGISIRKGRSWTIDPVATKIDLNETDKLIEDIQQARLGLVPYMELVDKITHPAKSVEKLVDRLEMGKPL
jgi:hypothetical protein